MAFTYGFYNYDANDAPEDQKLYDAETISELFDGLITDGVYGHVGHCFRVVQTSPTPDMAVTVRSGRAWFNHTWCYNDSDMRVEAPSTPSAGYSRMDALVIKIDRNARKNEITWHEGTPTTGSPGKPTLIKDDGIYEYPLAWVIRRSNETSITNAYISNAVGVAVDPSGINIPTPYVTGILETLDTTQLISTFESEYSRWIIEKQIEFDEWFEHIRDQLSEDAAGNLQNQIDSISAETSGTASATTARGEYIVVDGNIKAPINGTFYMEQTITLSSSNSVQATFENSIITTDSTIEVASDIDEISYRSIVVSEGQCIVTYPPYRDNGALLLVRIYIK